MSIPTEPSPFEEEDFVFLDPSTFEEEKVEKFPEKVKRHTLRSAARGVETLAGLPGDLRDFAQGLLTKGFGAVMGDQEKAEKISKSITPFIPGPLAQAPTSLDIREKITQPLSKDYLEPRSRGEEISDDVVSDLVALAIPIKGKIPFARALTGALGGAAAKESIKEMGGGTTAQTLGKLGTMFMLGNLGRGNARKYVSGLHQEAEGLIPEGTVMNAKKLEKGILKAKDTLNVGGVTPDKSHSLNLINQLLKKVRSGKGEIAPQEIKGFRQSVNELRFDRKLSPKAKFHLDRFDDVLNESLLDYGKENPAFLNKYREANLGTAGLKQSNKLSKAISKNVDITKLSPESIILLGVHNILSPSMLGKLGVGAAGAIGARLAKRITTNKTLRTHYLNTVKAGSSENWKSFSRNLNLLEKELAKEPDKEEVETFDFTEESS